MSYLTLLLPVLLGTLSPSPRACLDGRVLDDVGQPLGGAAVTLLGVGDGARVRLRTDDIGGFSVAELSAGSYWMVVEKLGFEPDVRALRLEPAEAWLEDIALTPLYELVSSPSGRTELPWLLRAMAGGPLRMMPDEPDLGLADSALFRRPLQGQVAWKALGGGDASSESETGGGKRALLSVEGRLLDDVDWYVNGRRDQIEYTSVDGAGELEAGEFEYGVGSSDHGLGFRSHVVRASRGTGAGEDAIATLGERRSAYILDYQSPDDVDPVDLSIAYRAAVADTLAGVNEGSDAEQSLWHAMWEGRGRLPSRLSRRHLLVTEFAVRAQRWSAPNTSLMADAVPQNGLLRDVRYLDPRGWQAYVAESHEWNLAGPLSLITGIDVATGSGYGLLPFLRPRVGAVLELDSTHRVRLDASWVAFEPNYQGDPLAGDPGHANGGFLVSLERDLLDGGQLQLSLERNGYRELDVDQPDRMLREDYQLYADGSVESHEVRLDLRLPARGGVTGAVSAAYGSANGQLIFVPVTRVRPGGERHDIPSGTVNYASASFGGLIQRTSTDVLVQYRWLEAARDGTQTYARIDVELEQALPWLDFAGARLGLLLALRAYLSEPEAGVKSDDIVFFEPSPVLAAGVGVNF